ncbi:MAG: ATPase, T2SS/T4P/T4SS family [Candidatus Micrarchaeota archaeon]
MCKLSVQRTRAVMDCASCPFEMFSAKCINSQLHDLSMLTDVDIKTMRYEEEIIIEFDEEKTRVIMEYANLIREAERVLSDPASFGRKEDDYYPIRKKFLEKMFEALFMSPVLALQMIKDYREPEPTKGIFMDGYHKFFTYLTNISEKISSTEFYKLVSKYKDVRAAFASLAGLKSFQFIDSLMFELPPDAKPITEPGAVYDLGFGITTKIYSLEKSEANLYTHENVLIQNLAPQLQKMLKQAIDAGMSSREEVIDPASAYDAKVRAYRQQFIDAAVVQGVPLSPQEAIAMGREAANWVVGLGSPIENMALDRNSITDIYIDSENSPIYIEHAKFGLCHTLWRYNKELLERAVHNIAATMKESRRFDFKNPILDTMFSRLGLRCHVQGPPATFGELQLAIRVNKETPFTYPQYVQLHSLTPFYAGYDDLMVGLGCSEAVLGLKGVGKTAFTAAKIIAIGTKKRILPIQDIEEIPVRAYRKRGFHIGAMHVQSSDQEAESSKELSLLTMANASLRMGDSCLIVNELRSRLAIQGLINLLNTQTGVFCLYNLHGQSIKDVQDRLETVFGVPAASLFTTERFSFLKKIKFKRKGPVHRVIAQLLETDAERRQFIELFTYKRSNSPETSSLQCNFIANPEASAWTLGNTSIASLEENLNINYIPPILQRRSEEAGLTPLQNILQAFFKGKIYSDLVKAANALSAPALTEIDFVLKCNAEANALLAEKEQENGSIDYKDVEPLWMAKFKDLVEAELRSV